ncbi:uncharacterized protein Mb2253c-like [Hibiscus syriacus]|uniref:uncharacterized protein Mb2253c-like n=1 Tax=Hibiscus syriacus TaxID=106335 RepID=UPI00192515D7|nr:uncharacterized protein Mb2253c-like [Hibiscus syriacus]
MARFGCVLTTKISIDQVPKIISRSHTLIPSATIQLEMLFSPSWMASQEEEEEALKDEVWKMNFDGASNVVGYGIGAILVSPEGDNYPFTSRLAFECTNNMEEYEACILGIRATIEHKIKILEVFGDSALVIYQLHGEWMTQDSKLIEYKNLVMDLINEFEEITFTYLPREENRMVDALATLASMFKANDQD